MNVMIWILSLPEPVRLTLAFFLTLLLPAGFLALCAPAVRLPQTRAHPGTVINGLTVGLPLCLLIWLALRQSLSALVWSFAAAAALSLVPVALDRIVRQRGGQSLPSLSAPVRLSIALFVPLFFLYAGLVEGLLRVQFPHVYALPGR